MDLERLGWCSFFEENFIVFKERGLTAGKVITKLSDQYLVSHKGREFHAKLTGRFIHNAHFNKDFPTVGDWVVFDMKVNSNHVPIHAILPRNNGFVRKLPISGGRRLKKGIIDGGSLLLF